MRTWKRPRPDARLVLESLESRTVPASLTPPQAGLGAALAGPAADVESARPGLFDGSRLDAVRQVVDQISAVLKAVYGPAPDAPPATVTGGTGSDGPATVFGPSTGIGGGAVNVVTPPPSPTTGADPPNFIVVIPAPPDAATTLTGLALFTRGRSTAAPADEVRLTAPTQAQPTLLPAGQPSAGPRVGVVDEGELLPEATDPDAPPAEPPALPGPKHRVVPVPDDWPWPGVPWATAYWAEPAAGPQVEAELSAPVVAGPVEWASDGTFGLSSAAAGCLFVLSCRLEAPSERRTRRLRGA